MDTDSRLEHILTVRMHRPLRSAALDAILTRAMQALHYQPQESA